MADEQKRNDWTKYPPRYDRPRPDKRFRNARREIMASDPACKHCGSPATEVDHDTPVCMGGTDARSNLVPICRDCHRSKTGREANHMRWHVHKVRARKAGQSG